MRQAGPLLTIFILLLGADVYVGWQTINEDVLQSGWHTIFQNVPTFNYGLGYGSYTSPVCIPSFFFFFGLYINLEG